jgi:hypothetical protein
MTVNSLFTAAEIARCLNCTPQNVRKSFRIPADGKKPINGVEAAAWSFGSFPLPIIGKLAQLALKHGFQSPLQLLQNAPTRSALPQLSHVAPDEIERAQKLRRAFAASFAMPGETSISELARVAAPHYAREFGCEVSDRYLRKLIDRVSKADGGARNFARLEIYLPTCPARKRVRSSPLSGRFEFSDLDAHFAAIANIAKPNLRDIAFAWRKVVVFFCDRVTGGANAAALKKELRSHLLNVAPFLADSPAAMKRNLNRKLRDAAESGIESLVDGRARPARRRSRKPADFDANLGLLVKHTVKFCERRDSQAYRQLHMGTTHNGERFSDEFRRAFPFDCRRRKSEMPKCVRDAVRSMVETSWTRHLGPRATRRTRPRCRRDWSGVYSGDYIVGDDMTGDHAVHEFRDDGEYECDKGRFNFGRPQVLPVFDELTTLPHGFALRLCLQPVAEMICTGLSRVFRDPRIGMPHIGLTLEMGRYASHAVTELIRWPDIDEAFGRQGIELTIHRAHSPEAKSRAEGPIGRIQQMFAYGHGYVGHNERSVQYERAQRFKARLKRVGQPYKPAVDPSEGSMSLEEYGAELERVFERYANEPQNGEILRDHRGLGLSPIEGWNQFRSGKPHRVLQPELMFLLTTRRFKPKVTSDGISISLNGVEHVYQDSEKLGSFVGERMVVRLNTELPEYIAVAHLSSDPHGRNAFAVPLEARLPAKTATREQLAARGAAQARFMSFGKTIYREFCFGDNTTISKANWGTPDLRAAGRRHQHLEREQIELSARRDSESGAIRALAAKQNLAIDPRRVKRPDRVRQRLESAERRRSRILEIERQLAAKEQST